MTDRPTTSYPHWTPMFPINSVARPTAMRIASGRPLGKPLLRRHACQSSHGPTARTVISSLLQIGPGRNALHQAELVHAGIGHAVAEHGNEAVQGPGSGRSETQRSEANGRGRRRTHVPIVGCRRGLRKRRLKKPAADATIRSWRRSQSPISARHFPAGFGPWMTSAWRSRTTSCSPSWGPPAAARRRRSGCSPDWSSPPPARSSSPVARRSGCRRGTATWPWSFSKGPFIRICRSAATWASD